MFKRKQFLVPQFKFGPLWLVPPTLLEERQVPLNHLNEQMSGGLGFMLWNLPACLFVGSQCFCY
jgi:hypothetical protein